MFEAGSLRQGSGYVLSKGKIEMTVSKPGLAVFAAGLLVSTAALAEQVKTEAVVTSVSGNTINARTVNGPLTVILTPSTKIIADKWHCQERGQDHQGPSPRPDFHRHW